MPQAAQLQAFARAGQQALEEPQVGTQGLLGRFGLAQLLGQSLLRGPLGGEQAFSRVGHLPGLGVGFAQHHHLGAQALQFQLAPFVQTGNALAELEGPQRQCGREAQRQRHQRPTQRPGQAAAHDHARRTHRQATTQQLPTHGSKTKKAGL